MLVTKCDEVLAMCVKLMVCNKVYQSYQNYITTGAYKVYGIVGI